MAGLGLREALMILLFNLVVPSLDQYTDVTIILRLMAGPDPDTHLVTGMCSVYNVNQHVISYSLKIIGPSGVCALP